MEREKIEGTLYLEGLLEGKLPRPPDSAAKLRQWVGLMAGLGPKFTLDVDGPSFSILPEAQAVSMEKIGGPAAEFLSDALRELLKIFPPEERGRLFSTLKSIEYRPDLEVQTLYVITPDGQVDTREQIETAHTKAPPRPLTRKELIRLALTGLGAAALVFALSSFFVNWGEVWSKFWRGVSKVDPKTPVELGSYKEYLTVDKVESDRSAITLTLKRTAAYPKDDAALDAAAEKAGKSVTARLTVEAIARGYIYIETFAEKGEFLDRQICRIRELREKETLQVRLYLNPRKKRPARILLTY